MRVGSMRYRQYGREAFVQAGDCVLIDCKEPYQQDCPQTTRCVALRFPEEWLRNWLPSPERVVARAFSPTGGWGTALSAVLANLDTDMKVELALPDSVVAEQIAALLALASGPNDPVPSGRDKLRSRLTRTLRDRCHESDLTPAAVAADHRISKRYLHYVFSQANTTFGDELMRVRLETAHRLLSDKRYDGVSVMEVAARCGFVAPSHFARRFRETYGLGPIQFRRARRCGPGPTLVSKSSS
jgi:AraC-like DNA-binding protein